MATTEKEKTPINDEILGDPAKLEDANMFFFENYDTEQSVEIKVDNDRSETLFQEKESAAKLVQDSLSRKDEMLKKLENRFGDRFSENKIEVDAEDILTNRTTVVGSNGGSSAQTNTNKSSSTFTGSSPSSSTSYAYNGTTAQQAKTILQSAEDKSSKFSDKAIKTARENFQTDNKRKRRKRSKVDKLLPKGSKRRKAAIIGGAIAIETVVSGLFFIQALAKHQLHAKILGGLDEKSK